MTPRIKFVPLKPGVHDNKEKETGLLKNGFVNRIL